VLLTRRRILIAFALTAVPLIVSGLYLRIEYQPTGWDGRPPLVSLMRYVHIASGFMLVVATLALAGAAVFTMVRRHWMIFPVAAAAAGAAIAALYTGYLLPWEQVGLYAVTVGENALDGTSFSGDNIVFVLVDGQELSARAYNWRVTLHAWILSLLLPILLVVLTFMLPQRPRITSRPA
jgi:quinol-cytochrome oxidoreductase complex cytochrome b subunit